MIVGECESDPNPQLSFHRDDDIMATVVVMLQNVNETRCPRHVVSYLVEVSHSKAQTQWQNKKYSMLRGNSRRGGRRKTRESERGNVDMGGLLVRKKPLSRS